MLISHLSESVRYTGRWAKLDDAAVTTAPGAYFELAFKGSACDLMFNTDLNPEPVPRLYLQLDGGAKIEAPVSRYMRVEAPDDGNHVVTVYYKGAMQDQQRWYAPLAGKITFIGANADAEGELPADDRKIIEFIGDSITEGIWVDEEKHPYGSTFKNHRNMVFQNDSTATYAYLTAAALGMRPYIMGYGSVGLTKGGGGGVPKASEAYPYTYHNIPNESIGAEIIVINHGANDKINGAELYLEEYEKFLDIVRQINPDATIIALSAFLGFCNDELGELIEKYNKSRGDNIIYIDSAGWVPYEPIHPLREGHQTIAQLLTKEIREKLKL